MNSDFSPLNEILLLLHRWIEAIRQKLIKRIFQKKIANVHSIYLHLKPTELGTFDLKNLQYADLVELHNMCRYLTEINYNSNLVALLYDETKIPVSEGRAI